MRYGGWNNSESIVDDTGMIPRAQVGHHLDGVPSMVSGQLELDHQGRSRLRSKTKVVKVVELVPELKRLVGFELSDLSQ